MKRLEDWVPPEPPEPRKLSASRIVGWGTELVIRDELIIAVLEELVEQLKNSSVTPAKGYESFCRAMHFLETFLIDRPCRGQR